MATGDRHSDMPHRPFTAVAIVAAVTASMAGCGSSIALRSTPSSTPDPQQRYQVTALIVSNGRHGPELCAGPQPAIAPPECDGPPVVRWDWSTVTGKTTMYGTTWGSYHLVGTFDGISFTLMQPPTPPTVESVEPPPDFSPPCPQPPGGWPKISTQLGAYQAFVRAAQSPPDFAGMWVDQQSQVGDPGRDVMTVAYTGDVERHRADLSAIWNGPFCVIHRARSLAALLQIQRELPGVGRGLGLKDLSSEVDPVRDRVEATVLFADPAAQQALNRQFGLGVVVLTGEITPVSRLNRSRQEGALAAIAEAPSRVTRAGLCQPILTALPFSLVIAFVVPFTQTSRLYLPGTGAEPVVSAVTAPFASVSVVPAGQLPLRASLDASVSALIVGVPSVVVFPLVQVIVPPVPREATLSGMLEPPVLPLQLLSVTVVVVVPVRVLHLMPTKAACAGKANVTTPAMDTNPATATADMRPMRELRIKNPPCSLWFSFIDAGSSRDRSQFHDPRPPLARVVRNV